MVTCRMVQIDDEAKLYLPVVHSYGHSQGAVTECKPSLDSPFQILSSSMASGFQGRTEANTDG